MHVRSLMRLGATVLLAAGAIGAFSIASAQGGAPAPIPTVQPEQGGPLDPDTMPAEIPQLARDGSVLHDQNGAVVMVPFGAVARGEVSRSAADAAYARAARLQAEDAVKRGLRVGPEPVIVAASSQAELAQMVGTATP